MSLQTTYSSMSGFIVVPENLHGVLDVEQQAKSKRSLSHEPESVVMLG